MPTDFSTTNITPIYRRLVAAAAFLRLRRLMSARLQEKPIHLCARWNALSSTRWDQFPGTKFSQRGRWLRRRVYAEKLLKFKDWRVRL